VATKVIPVKKSKFGKKYREKLLQASKNRHNHIAILRHSLTLLIEELLPVAVRKYQTDPGQGATYSVTNIIAEIRGVISQIETSVDTDSILIEVNKAVATAIRISINRMANHLVILKESLPVKIQDSATRRNMAIILDGILKEYEVVMMGVVSEVEARVAVAVKDVVKGKIAKRGQQPKIVKKKQKQKKR
jgi:hypothetical protein